MSDNSNIQQTLKYMKTIDSASGPFKGTERSAGFDLSSAFKYCIPPGGRGLIETGIRVQLPLNCYGRIANRSGISLNHVINTRGVNI